MKSRNIEKALKTSDIYLTLGTVVEIAVGHQTLTDKGFCPKENL